MADNNNNNNKFIVGGASLTKPPGITRENYSYWKERVEMYIKSTLHRL